eukprot:4182807-Amphidinium_carterae.2
MNYASSMKKIFTIPCARDASTQRIMGTVAPSKESHLYTVACIHQQIRITRHRRFLFKSDREHNDRALKNAVTRELDKSVGVFHEESAVKDSDGNGAVEQTVRILADEVRALKCATDTSLQQVLETGRPAIAWLLMHAGHTLGEGCLYRPLGALARKLDARWEVAVWLTTLEQSLEHVVGLSNGDVAKCRDIKALPGVEG